MTQQKCRTLLRRPPRGRKWSQPPTEVHPEPEEGDGECVKPFGSYPNERDSTCGSFVQCTWGQPVLQHCPSGLVFHPDLGVCVWNYQYDCLHERQSFAYFQNYL